MKTVTIQEAKTNLSQLIEEAVGGEEIIITRELGPEVRLIPVANVKGPRKPGSLKGKLNVGSGSST